MQDASFVAAEDRQADALKFLPGWKGGICEAVQCTPPDNISRSKLSDRSAAPPRSRRVVIFQSGTNCSAALVALTCCCTVVVCCEISPSRYVGCSTAQVPGIKGVILVWCDQQIVTGSSSKCCHPAYKPSCLIYLLPNTVPLLGSLLHVRCSAPVVQPFVKDKRQQQPSLSVCNISQLCIAMEVVVSKCPACFCRWPPIGKGFSKGAVTLAGDAAHPMTPNLGQGGCTALEVSLNHNILLHCHVTMLPDVKYGSPTES